MNPDRVNGDLRDEDTWDLFLLAHYRLHRRSDLPDPTNLADDPTSPGYDPTYEAWREAMLEKGITFEDALAGSKKLLRIDHYPAAHFAHLLRLAGEARTERLDRARRDSEAHAAAARHAMPGGDEVADYLGDRVLNAHWRDLPDDERDLRLRAVRARYPGLARFERLVLAFALKALRDGGPIDTSRPNAGSVRAAEDSLGAAIQAMSPGAWPDPRRRPRGERP